MVYLTTTRTDVTEQIGWGQDLNLEATSNPAVLTLSDKGWSADRIANAVTHRHRHGNATELHVVCGVYSSPSNVDIEIAKALLDLGSDVNANAAGGIQPLFGAAGVGNQDLCDLLVSHGADISHAIEDGRTANDNARDKGYDTLADHLSLSQLHGLHHSLNKAKHQLKHLEDRKVNAKENYDNAKIRYDQAENEFRNKSSDNSDVLEAHETAKKNLESMNSKVGVLKTTLHIAELTLLAATAALALAATSNWIPFWDWGPSELATAAAETEEVEAAEEVTVAKLALETAEEELETAELAEANAFEEATEGEVELTRLGNEARIANSAKESSLKTLQGIEEKIVERKTNYRTLLLLYKKALAFFDKSHMDKIIERLENSVQDWQVLRKLDNILEALPEVTMTVEEDDEEEDYECSSEKINFNDIIPQEFWYDEMILIFIYSKIQTAWDGDFPEDLSSLYIIEPRTLEVFLEIQNILNSLGLPTLQCLDQNVMDFSDMTSTSHILDPEWNSLELMASGGIVRKLMASGGIVRKKGKMNQGRTIDLSSKEIFNVHGSAGDKRSGSSWIQWYAKTMNAIKSSLNIIKVKGKIKASEVNCKCRILKPAYQMDTVPNPKLHRGPIIGGHVHLPGKADEWIMLPICSGHNKSVRFDEDGDANRMTCKVNSYGIQISKYTG